MKKYRPEAETVTNGTGRRGVSATPDAAVVRNRTNERKRIGPKIIPVISHGIQPLDLVIITLLLYLGKIAIDICRMKFRGCGLRLPMTVTDRPQPEELP